MTCDVFISYRRADSDWPAYALHENLVKAFPGRVFLDVREIPEGADFPQEIENQLRSAAVCFVLIGSNWLVDRRLNSPRDWVRREIEIALSIPSIRVVPLLLSRGRMPEPADIPSSLHRILTRNSRGPIQPAEMGKHAGELIAALPAWIAAARNAAKRRDHLPGDVFLDETSESLSCLPQMKVIGPGRFMMGSKQREFGHNPSESPIRLIAMQKPFAISIDPITERDFNKYKSAMGDSSALIVDPSRRDLPATGVGWDDAVGFCDWASRFSGYTYRLPSEAEWEYCCRAGTNTAFATGDLIDFNHAHFNRLMKEGHQGRGDNLHNWNEFGPRGVVDCFVNAWGLRGMHGNVWEWAADCWHDTHAGAPNDGSCRVMSPKSDMKVARGGCFASGVRQLRSAARGRAGRQPKEPHKFGFRVVREV